MSQQFPFTRGSALDLSPGQRLPSAAFNAADKNAAQAADGLVWSDTALAKNWQKTTVATGNGIVIMWETSTGRWITAGVSAGAPTAQFSNDGREEWVALSVTAGTNWNVTASGACSGAGTVILGGGGGSATASKIRQSADGGATWAARSTTASGTEFVNCAVWHSGASLFVIGLNSTASTNIETSPDGVTWTQRTGLPNTNGRGASNGAGSSSGVASNGAMVVMLGAPTTTKCITSTDCVTWTERTLPASAQWSGVSWNARSGKWMAIASGQIATSADGIAWSASGLVAPFAGVAIALTSYGRMWVASGSTAGGLSQLRVSVDDGATWLTVKSLAAICTAIATGDNQICAAILNAVYATIRGGL